MEISLPYPDLKRFFWQQMMSFPKDASQKYSDCDQKILVLVFPNAYVHYRPSTKLSFLVPQDNFNSLNPDYAATVLSRMCRVFTIFRNEIETETLWAGRCN